MYQYYSTLDLESHRSLLFTAAIACFGVNEEVSDVCLVLWEIAGRELPGRAGDDGRVRIGNDGSVEFPEGFVIGDMDEESSWCDVRAYREERTHEPRADASGGMGEVEFQDGNDGRCRVGHDEIEGEQEIFFDLDCGVEGDRELRERLVWFGLWDVFVAQLARR